VLGDLSPRPAVLSALSSFFARFRETRLHVQYEAVTGPWERLFENEADLIVHRIDKTDERLEWIDIGRVALVPVVAPKFLPFPISTSISPTRMRAFTQCVLRDTAIRAAGESHFLVSGAPRCTVADHNMKKELILAGMAWGHLPRFLIREELRAGRLLSIAGRHFPGVTEELTFARRADRAQGPVAARLWTHLQECAPKLRRLQGAASASRARRAG
jgi:DNA-binding transcriptional LysR family regulator